MPTTAEEGLLGLIEKHAVCGRAAGALRSYLQLLQKWNARINLTGSSDWTVLGPLFEEAIWAARFHPGGSASHLDIGSGAGFPALPVAVLNPGVRLDLVESRSRKCVFLETAARELGLEGVRVHQQRFEAFLRTIEPPAPWVCVSWKAIRLPAREATELLRRAPGAQFWLFHGPALPLEDADAWERAARLCRREAFRGPKPWFLSIYVSRDTETPFHVKPPSPEPS